MKYRKLLAGAAVAALNAPQSSLGNVALVLKNHPELADEYTNPDSGYYDCLNAVRYRAWLTNQSAGRLA